MAPRNRTLGSTLATDAEALHPFEKVQNSLPFRPPSGFRPTLDIPRYLFRVCAPGSRGRTTPDLAQSASAASHHVLSQTCLFRLPDASLAADNLVSWTGSLLTALVYVFYRHARFRESFDDMFLYVVDAARFPSGTFLHDLDLLRAVQQHSSSGGVGGDGDGDALAKLEALYHRKQHRAWTGGVFCSGEVLSQRSLGLTGRCSGPVSARRMMDGGLLDLHPRFAELAQWTRGEADWSRLAAELRAPFYGQPGDGARRRHVYPNDAQIMSRIGGLFGVGWRAPVAVALLALAPNRMGATDLLLGFRLVGPTWNPVLEECFDSTAGGNPSNMLPEVSEFQRNLNDAYLESCEVRVGTCIDSVRATLQVAQKLITTVESRQHSARDVGRLDQRTRLFELVVSLSDIIENASPGKSASNEGGSEEVDEVA